MSDTPDWSYLSQINDFEACMANEPVSARARALWYRLMYHWNRAYWQQPIILSETVIRGELDLSHRQFLSARAELKGAGYIIHKAQGGRKAGKYWIKILRPPEGHTEKRAVKRRLWEENFLLFTTAAADDDDDAENIHEQARASLDNAAAAADDDFDREIREELRREAYGEGGDDT